jgi:hypothetical protein
VQVRIRNRRKQFMMHFANSKVYHNVATLISPVEVGPDFDVPGFLLNISLLWSAVAPLEQPLA